ncbi:VOC family protein [Pseudonocardia oroxyli]|uniref:Catechol 2,3-dioxygenase n=1 Tax=Pseudonocardia oroxyli TaxID=366584 RepID=A0A1G7ZHE0_PSEOR|nr:VOC family protein [Pseudonocardia oroxyli]SDH08162.1 Catechol 2,3-dioxygenase [Pseudonocardia oroxyli]
MSHIAVVTADLDLFRSFYEDILGCETTLVVGVGRDQARQAVVHAGDAMLQVFEVPGYAPDTSGAPMFERGRLDHFGFRVADEAALVALRDRLVAAGASSGDIRRLGPMLSLRFHDPEGFEGEVNCLDPAYDPSSVRDQDEIVDPAWYERTRRALGDHSATFERNRP